MDMKVKDLRLAQLNAVLNTMALWGAVREHEEITACEEEMSAGTKRQMRRTLLDDDTALVGFLLVRRHREGGGHYTLRELSHVLAPKEDDSLVKSAQGKLKKMLDRVGDTYGLFEYEPPEGKKAGCSSYRIWPSEKLLRIFDEALFPEIEKLLPVGAEIEN